MRWSCLGLLVLVSAAACADPDGVLPPASARLKDALAKVLTEGSAELASLTLVRSACCFESCPIYTLRIRGDGEVVYEGETNVDVVGIRAARVEPSVAGSLLAAFADGPFFNGPALDERVMGPPAVTLTLEVDGLRRTHVTHGSGAGFAALLGQETRRKAEVRAWVLATGDLIDEVAGSERWTGARTR